MKRDYAKGGRFLLAHPTGENSPQRNRFLIRVIRESRGFNCFYRIEPLTENVQPRMNE